MVEKSGVKKFRVEMSLESEHFNPRLINSRLFIHELHEPHRGLGLRSLWLKSQELRNPGLKLGVEKSGVGMSCSHPIV